MARQASAGLLVAAAQFAIVLRTAASILSGLGM